MSRTESKKTPSMPVSTGTDRFSPLPTEVFDCIGSHLAKRDLLRLRRVSREVQAKTAKSFAVKFLRRLSIRTRLGTTELQMILHFLKYADMASTIKEVYVIHTGSSSAEARQWYHFFAEIMEKVPAALETVTIMGGCILDRAFSKPCIAPNELLRAVVGSAKKVAAIKLVDVCVEHDLSKSLFALQRNTLQRLDIEKCTLDGGAWNLLHIFAKESKLKHVFLSEIRTTVKPDEYFAFTEQNLMKAIKNSETGKFENYHLHRFSAWFMGAEAVKIGFKAVFGGQN